MRLPFLIRKPAVFFTLALIMFFGALALSGCRESEPPPAPKRKESAPAATAAPTPAASTPAPAAADGASTPSAAISGPRLILSGVVKLDDTGAPAAGARVKASDFKWTGEPLPQEIEAASVKTDAQGRYRIETTDTQALIVSASLSGYARAGNIVLNRKMSMGEDSAADSVRRVSLDFALKRPVAFRGRAMDARDQPAAGAKIRAALVMNSREFREIQEYLAPVEIAAGEDGKFEFTDMAASQYALVAEMPGYAPVYQTVTSPDENVIIRFSGRGATLAGHVFLKSSGAAIAGAKVSLWPIGEGMQMMLRPPYNQDTDEAGAFRFENLAPGRYSWTAAKKGLLFYQRQTKTPNPNSVNLEEGQEVEDLEILLYPGHTVRGVVREKSTGQPIEGVSVRNLWGGGPDQPPPAVTGPEGEYVLTGVSGQMVGLEAKKEGYSTVFNQPHMQIVQVALDPAVLEVVQDIEMVSSVQIRGRVINELGRPVPDAWVTLYSGMHGMSQADAGTPVDAEGRFSLAASPFSTYRVKTEAQDYAVTFSEAVQVLDRTLEGVEITMKPTAGATGLVVDPSGAPAEGARVAAEGMIITGGYGFSHVFGETSTDSQGRWTLTGLPASQELQLYAQKQGFASSEMAPLSLRANETRPDLRLELRQSVELAGRVVNTEGEPIENVSIFIHTMRGNDRNYGNAQTDREGRFRIEGLVATPCRASLNHPEYGYENLENITPGGEEVEWVMGNKTRVTLTGWVRDAATNEPIADFTVNSNSWGGLRKDPETPGRFIHENLMPGVSYTYTITAPGYAALDTGYVEVPKSGETFERTFKLGAGGTLKGRVVAKDTKAPMPGVTALLYGAIQEWEISQTQPKATATTDEEGRFSFSKTPAGRNLVIVQPAAPLVAARRWQEVKHGEVADLGDVEIGGGAEIRGRVVRAPGDTPVEGAVVTLQSYGSMRDGGKTATTDAAGAFTFTGLMDGNYGVMLSERSIGQNVEIKEGKSGEVILRLGDAVLRVHVVKGGAPFSAQVFISQSSGVYRYTTTDGKGFVQMEGIAPGEWTVGAQSTADWRLRAQTQVTLAAGEEKDLTLKIPGGRIVGTVTSAAGETVRGAQIQAKLARPETAEQQNFSQTYEATSGADGTFAIEGLPAAQFAVSAEHPDHGMAFEPDVQVPEDADSEWLTLQLGAGGSGTLVSVALKLSDGSGLPEAWLRLYRDGAEIAHGRGRDDEGTLAVPNLPPGRYKVEVSSWGYSIHEREVEIKEGETTTIEDVLYDAGALRWTLVDAAGAGLSGAECRITPNDPASIERPRAGRTDSTGLLIVRGLFPGAYTAEATLSDGRAVSAQITILAHELTQEKTEVK